MATWIWAYEAHVSAGDVAAIAQQEQVSAVVALETITAELMSLCGPLRPRLHGRWLAGDGWQVLFGGTLQADSKKAAAAIIDAQSAHGAPQAPTDWGEVLHLVEMPEPVEVTP